MIADKALEQKTGARGLRTLWRIMLDVMYNVPTEDMCPSA